VGVLFGGDKPTKIPHDAGTAVQGRTSLSMPSYNQPAPNQSKVGGPTSSSDVTEDEEAG